jgi:hypothetical protein
MKPFVTAVIDYHDFEEVQYHFANAGIKLKYEEVGCGYSHIWNAPYGGYHAVFYQNKKEATKLIKFWKNQFK